MYTQCRKLSRKIKNELGKSTETPDGLRWGWEHKIVSDHISQEKWKPESVLYTVPATNTASSAGKEK